MEEGAGDKVPVRISAKGTDTLDTTKLSDCYPKFMENVWASMITSLVSAVVGGALAVWGAIKAVEKTARDLEAAEIRKERINCLVALSGLRFTISTETTLPVEWQARLVYELNKVPALWSDEGKTLNSFQRYLDESSVDNFLTLLRLLSKATKLNLEKVRDADLIRYARPTTWNKN